MRKPPQDIQIRSLAQFSEGEEWRVGLVHDRPYHVLIWITRGQGVMILDGERRGVGAHNAIYVPAGTLFSLELSRQSVGQVVILPQAIDVQPPDMAELLRIRTVQAQGELTALIESAGREDSAQRPFCNEAMEGYVRLILVWLRRQMAEDEHIPDKPKAAQRLSRAFCAEVATRFRTGDVMANYAARLGVTPTHLTRATKAATGKTAADLLTERVLHEARALLVETTIPAQQIAKHLGFGSAAYFTRFIQNNTGQTPSRLRKMASAQQTLGT